MGSAAHRRPATPLRPLVLSRPRRGRPAPRPSQVPGLAARTGALHLLDAVLIGAEMLEDNSGRGTGAERAESRGLADLTLRRLGQIDAVLQTFVDLPPKGSGLQILRLMAAELLFHGTPPHAGVDLAVRLAQAKPGTRKLAGLINAVGRRIGEAGDALLDGHDAADMNVEGWLWDRLVKDWGTGVARHIVEAHLEPPPHDLTLRTAADGPALGQETGGEILPTGSLRLPGRPQITALPGYEHGAWWVQDAAAALPAQLLGDVRGKRVLDLCAAPGGKTLQLSAAGAEVTALDQSEARMARLRQNLDRTGLAAEMVIADALKWSPDTPFDAVLVDAPCSATGTVRRHPDLPLRGSGKGIGQLEGLQHRLASRAVDWLVPGGTLVFCTCSLLKSEGEDQARRLAEVPGMRPVAVSSDEMPAEFVTPEGWLRTRPDMWPGLGGLDGFFAARFQRDK